MAYTTNGTMDIRNLSARSVDHFLVKSGVKIYQGMHLSRTAGAVTVEPCTDDAGANVFAGVAAEESEIGDGTAVYVKVYNHFERRVSLRSSVTAAQLEKALYAYDDEQLTEVSSCGPIVGVLKEFIASGDGWVRYGDPAIGPAAS
jgi:hypothetical protein